MTQHCWDTQLVPWHSGIYLNEAGMRICTAVSRLSVVFHTCSVKCPLPSLSSAALTILFLKPQITHSLQSLPVVLATPEHQSSRGGVSVWGRFIFSNAFTPFDPFSPFLISRNTWASDQFCYFPFTVRQPSRHGQNLILINTKNLWLVILHSQ